MTVYEKEAIPSRFYYKKGKFVSPLTLLADEGWFITEVIRKYTTTYALDKCCQTTTGTSSSAFTRKRFCFHLGVVHYTIFFFRDSRGLVG